MPYQRRDAREDARLGNDPGSLDSGAGTNLPRRDRRRGRAAEEAAGLLPAILLSHPERVLTIGRDLTISTVMAVAAPAATLKIAIHGMDPKWVVAIIGVHELMIVFSCDYCLGGA